MRTAIGEVVGAVVAIVLAVLCWNLGIDVHHYAAVPDGAPAYTSTRYSGSWIAVATVCVVVAGVLVTDGIRRLSWMRSHTR
ncbi:hypothetical protein [Rhodococcoides kyotonense]|uniref:Uncharacterized protein n=1 Tax=Rhodococcoides kyotonense TaxID=398843 RepID=A0A239M645_9NOCA|nr:hypothetical protein [Rhodococcus kyotonensis]SNT38081.1 hypothetical protein SAMN05421642_11641 [Rhodococcus kyotonensis]